MEIELNLVDLQSRMRNDKANKIPPENSKSNCFHCQSAFNTFLLTRKTIVF